MEYAKDHNRDNNYVSVNTLIQPKKYSAKLKEKSTSASTIQERARASTAYGKNSARSPLSAFQGANDNNPQQTVQTKLISQMQGFKENEGMTTQGAPIQMAGWGAVLGGILGGGIGLGIGALAAFSNPVTAAIAISLGIGGLVAGHYATQGIPQIPNNMHFVWMGGQVPDGRRHNMEQWAQSIGGAQVNLWLDGPALQANRNQLEEMKAKGIIIRSISDELAVNSERLRVRLKDMPTVDEKGVNAPVTGALSDVVRLEILSQVGGTYMDSDNTPGKNATTFENREAPMGLRLGFGQLYGQKAFSNDAMASLPNDHFINTYLDRAYQNLDDRDTRARISGRNPEISREAVMDATGPRAMAKVPLPLTPEQLEAVNADLSATVDGGGTLREKLGLEDGFHNGITIQDISKIRQWLPMVKGGEKAIPGLNGVLRDLAFGEDTFTRAVGNAWVLR